MKLIVFFGLIFLICISKSKIKVHLAILLMAILCSTRPDIVPDTLNYKDLLLDNINSQYNAEIGFEYVCYFFHNILGLNFSQFLFVLAFLSGEIWYAITRRILNNADIGLVFMMFFSFFGIYYFCIVLRASLAILICYLGLLFILQGKARDYLLYVSILALAFLFHRTSILFLFVPLCLIRYNSSILYSLLVLSVIFTIIHPFSFIQLQLEAFLSATSESGEFSRYAGYIDEEIRESGIDLIYVSYLIIAAGAILLRDRILGTDKDLKTYNMFLNMYVIGIVLYSLFIDFRAASRIPMQWLFFEFVIAYFLLFKTRISSIQKNRFLLYFLFCVFKFILLVHRTPLLLSY